MSQTDAPIAEVLSDALLAKILEANRQLPAAFQAIAPVYAPAVIRIVQTQGLADLTALYAKLSGTTPEVLDQLHAAMTAAELAAEKQQLTPLFTKMAQDSVDARQLGQQILGAALRAAVGVALTALTF